MVIGRARIALLALTVLTQAACEEDDAEFPPGTADAASPATASDAGIDAGRDASSPANGKLDFSSFDRALEAAIAAHNQSAPESQKIRGASAVVVEKARGVLHEQGYLEHDAKRLYLIASASKILSVGVLMRLADQGLLDLDKPIASYLGEWGEHKGQVTVAQLVSNSSGLPSLGEIIAMPGGFSAHLCQYSDVGTLAACGKSIYSDDLPANNRPPDQMFRYGGSQWQLAGAVAEVVSKKSWAQLVEETYDKPCDVPSLGYTNQFGKNSGLGYPAFFQANVANLPTTENPSIEGGAYVSAGDYGKLLWMHLRGGTCGDTRVLSEKAVATMQQNRIAKYGGSTGNPTLPGYGLGWWVSEETDVVADPGAYGAYPYIDQKRGYAAFIAIEVSAEVGAKLVATVKPTLDAIFDAAR